MLKEIGVNKFLINCYDVWENGCFILTSGDLSQGKYNSMTVAWGSFGSMWGKPFAMVVVRPTRYTYEFMEKYDSFTLCAFPAKYREKLQFLGSVSGRVRNKILESGLTLVASQSVASPCYEEANLVVECRKVYWDDLDPSHFLSPDIERNYPKKDYHRMYFGEITGIRGESPPAGGQGCMKDSIDQKT